MTLASMVKWYNSVFLFILLSFATCPNALALLLKVMASQKSGGPRNYIHRKELPHYALRKRVKVRNEVRPPIYRTRGSLAEHYFMLMQSL